MSWAEHYKKWSDCDRCSLSESRCKVAVGKGSIPADVLFVGEAPSYGDDSIGIPFIGPSGKLLDEMIAVAKKHTQPMEWDYALTNLLGCIPKDEEGRKVHNPSKYAREVIKDCSPRLREFFDLVQPKLVFWVGKDSEKLGPRALGKERMSEVGVVSIMHPAAILQMHIAQRGLAFQRNWVNIRDGVMQWL